MRREDDDRWDRDGELERIKATYAGYESAGRYRLWDRELPGFALLSADLDRRMLDALERSLVATERRVLDLGCGSGELAAQASRLRAEWTGVDLRPEAVAAARLAYPRAAFMVASGDALPFHDATFDVVVARVLFSSLPSARLERAVASEISRVLRPGGWLIWLDLRYASPTNAAVHAMPRRRITRLFAGWTQQVAAAGLLPPVARRLGPATPLAYPVLSRVPLLRSHLVGRLRRPR